MKVINTDLKTFESVEIEEEAPPVLTPGQLALQRLAARQPRPKGRVPRNPDNMRSHNKYL